MTIMNFTDTSLSAISLYKACQKFDANVKVSTAVIQGVDLSGHMYVLHCPDYGKLHVTDMSIKAVPSDKRPSNDFNWKDGPADVIIGLAARYLFRSGKSVSGQDN